MPIPTTYDSLFQKYAGRVPVGFLRALSYAESRLNPNDVHPTSRATGLFQVVSVVLRDYNKKHGTAYTFEDIRDPELNTKIGTELINRIVDTYERYHPDVLSPDWKDPRYVALVVYGFNAGYGGVIQIIRRMKAAGIQGADRFTTQSVWQASQVMTDKWARYIQMEARRRYANAVASAFFNPSRTPELDRLPPETPEPEEGEEDNGEGWRISKGWAWGLGAATVGILGLLLLRK